MAPGGDADGHRAADSAAHLCRQEQRPDRGRSWTSAAHGENPRRHILKKLGVSRRSEARTVAQKRWLSDLAFTKEGVRPVKTWICRAALLTALCFLGHAGVCTCRGRLHAVCHSKKEEMRISEMPMWSSTEDRGDRKCGGGRGERRGGYRCRGSIKCRGGYGCRRRGRCRDNR